MFTIISYQENKNSKLLWDYISPHSEWPSSESKEREKGQITPRLFDKTLMEHVFSLKLSTAYIV